MQQNVDYSPLDSIKQQTVHLGIIFAGFGLFFAYVFILMANYRIFLIPLILASVVLVIYGIKKWNDTNAANNRAMSDFAAVNNMAYEANDIGRVNAYGSLFDQGHSKSTTRVLSGMLSGLPFRCFEYCYETGSGKNRRTYDAMVMEITLPRVLPQFVIDSQLEDVMPVAFDKSQKIELEGDFHKYFDLYAPDTYGVSALTILAPDAMEVLMHHAALCDIEVVQNKLFFYWPTPAKTKIQYEEIFTTTQATIAKLGKKLTQDNIFGSVSQAQMHAVPGASGVRLKRSKIGFVVVGVIVLYVIAQFTENTQLSGIGLSFIGLFWVSFIGWSIFSSAKRTRLRQEYLRRYRSK